MKIITTLTLTIMMFFVISCTSQSGSNSVTSVKHKKYFNISYGTGEIANERTFNQVDSEAGLELNERYTVFASYKNPTDEQYSFYAGINRKWLTRYGEPYVRLSTNEAGGVIGAGFEARLTNRLSGNAGLSFTNDYKGHNSEMAVWIGATYPLIDNTRIGFGYEAHDYGVNGRFIKDMTKIRLMSFF